MLKQPLEQEVLDLAIHTHQELENSLLTVGQESISNQKECITTAKPNPAHQTSFSFHTQRAIICYAAMVGARY